MGGGGEAGGVGEVGDHDACSRSISVFHSEFNPSQFYWQARIIIPPWLVTYATDLVIYTEAGPLSDLAPLGTACMSITLPQAESFGCLSETHIFINA